MGVHRPHGNEGWIAIKKTAGQGTPPVGTQTDLVVSLAQPRNPNNIVYPGMINVAQAPSIKIRGKKTPMVSLIGMPAKESYLTSALLNSLLILRDSNGHTDEFCIAINNGASTRKYSGGKCTQVSLYQTAAAPGIFCDLGFLCTHGDSEDGGAPAFVTPSTDGGQAYDVASVSFNSTAEQVDLWRLTIQRGQGYNFYCDGSYYSAAIQSGIIGGLFNAQQNPGADTVPSTSVTIRIGGGGTGVQIVANLSKDEYLEDVAAQLGVMGGVWTLFNNGAVPVAITPF